MHKKPHIFISYSRQDTFFMRYLKDKLENETSEYTVWADVSDIEAGEDWAESIDYAIKSAFVVLIIISPNSIASQYVQYEWCYALGSRVGVIPIYYRLLDNYERLLHKRLGQLERVDFTNPDMLQWEKLTRSISKAFQEHNERKRQTRKYLDVDSLREQIESGSESEVLNALSDVIGLGVAEVADTVWEKLTDTSPDVRAYALTALWEIDEYIYTDVVIYSLSDFEWKVRQNSYYLLAQTENPELIHKLVKLAENIEARMFGLLPVARINAVRLLGIKTVQVASHDEGERDFSLNKLVKLLKDENPHVVGAVIEQFETLHSNGLNMQSYVPTLMNFLGDEREAWVDWGEQMNEKYESIRSIARRVIDTIQPGKPNKPRKRRHIK